MSAGFSQAALRLMVLLPKELTVHPMGGCQNEQIS